MFKDDNLKIIKMEFLKHFGMFLKSRENVKMDSHGKFLALFQAFIFRSVNENIYCCFFG